MTILDERIKNVRTAELDEGEPTISQGTTPRGTEEIYTYPAPIEDFDLVALSNTVPIEEDALIVKKAAVGDVVIGYMRGVPQNGLTDLGGMRRRGRIELIGETYRAKIKAANAPILSGDKVALVDDGGKLVFDKDAAGTSKVLSLHHRAASDTRMEIEVIFPKAFV